MIYELRYYTLRPGARETLIELFEREFVETQEAVGSEVLGTFRDPDNPDTFPWIRRFPDMESRRMALEAFYGGPAWKAHRDAANATMLDSDNVLLLRPALVPVDGLSRSERPPVGATEPPGSLYVATIHHVDAGFAGQFAEHALPVLLDAGVPVVACFETEHAENTFPALPVRTDVNVFAWFARFDTVEDYRIPSHPVLDEAPRQVIRLAPTVRSALR
ncbi:NIPSNAP family protein [Nonomuraea sp. NPDC050536]|uniref:NIPSNAP family protein n=1 Tax=Nonomuraea sp. NPDC050536 TaxID=3364366 RepID=UPI0037C6430F